MTTTYHSPFLPILSGTIHINGHKDIELYGCLSLVKSLMLSGFYPSPLAFGAVLHTQINWLEWHKYCQSLTSSTSWYWSSMPWSVSKIAIICSDGTPSSQKSCRKMIDFSSYEYLLWPYWYNSNLSFVQIYMSRALKLKNWFIYYWKKCPETKPSSLNLQKNPCVHFSFTGKPSIQR